MSERTTVVVPEELAGLRADRVLAIVAEMSRSSSRRLIEAGVVTADGRAVERSTALTSGTVLEYPLADDTTTLLAEDIAFELAFESENIIVVDKPAGLVVHPGAGHTSGTLVNGLIHRFADLEALGEEHRWGLVHRLDRDTSGLLLVARTRETHSFLQQELKERRIYRTYVALVAGRLDAATGTIDAPIGRDPSRPTRMGVVQDGRPARTHYRCLAEWSDVTLVEIRLETGRTHQIRVHFSSIGLGVVGDPVYGTSRAAIDTARIWLHAIKLRFPMGDGTHQEVSSPLPADLRAVLNRLGEPAEGTIDV
jgi:23S rRNA pseudouridine1911/1915/1917 synthase